MEKKSRCPGAVSCYKEFKRLTKEEKAVFFGKYFAAELRGLNADFKKSVKTQWKDLQKAIGAEQKKQATIDGLDAIELPILKEAVARREKAAAKKK